MKPYLSIVIPVYNEVLNFRAGVLKPSFYYLREQKYSWEVIFVDDGSSDNSYSLLQAFCQKNKHCRLLAIPHGGRAAAMTKAMLAAQGKFILYTDFDQSTEISQIEKFFAAMKKGSDLAIGTRGYGRSLRIDSTLNKFRAKAFAWLARTVLLPGIIDINCGFKLYKHHVAKRIFSSLKVYAPRKLNGPYMGAVDSEILYLARKFGFKITQIPVDWVRRPATRLNLWSETSRMLLDLAKMKYYDLSGRYN